MSEKRSSKETESERLERLYRKSSDPVLRTHLLMVWRMSLGDSVGEVAEMVGYSKKWTTEIKKWTTEIGRRYASGGVEALGDRRHSNPGAKERALLDEAGEAELLEALQGSPPATLGGGMWSGPKVASWIAQRNGLDKVHIQRGFESEEAQIQPAGSKAPKRLRSFASLQAGGFQKTLPERVKTLQEAYPGAKVELWARLGLKPVTRRVWSPVGQRPTASVKRGYEWTYLYGFVRPTSGEVYWLILPTVNKELFSMALQEFAKEVGAGEDKRVLLVLDQAGWHTSGEVEIPEGVHLEFLPSGSPELQPAERLWPLTNEAIANRLFEEICEIEHALVERCVQLLDQAETIRDLTNYHWWPQAV